MAFTSDEADRIKRELILIGKKHFSSFGLRRSRVEDIARESGIAKGSFYRFFQSKEDLCFAVLEEEEKIRDKQMSEDEDPPRTDLQLKSILLNAFRAFRDSSVAMRLYELEEFPQLVRKLSQERIAAHQQADTQRMVSLISSWQDKGSFPDIDPSLVAGLFRAIMVLSFQRDSIGVESFDEVMELMISSVAKGLMGHG